LTLYFIGLGLCGVKGLTLEGLEAVKRCRRVYVEHYTSLVPGLGLGELERLLEGKVQAVDRGFLEGEGAEKVLEEALEDDVALLTPGDPFIATTHNALRLEALKRGVKVKVVHSASVASAVPGATGLSFYKFGRTATVVYPEPNYVPEAAYDAVKENLAMGLHTLLLLDLKVERGAFMKAPEALRILLDIEARRGEGVLTKDAVVVAVARAGCDDVEVKAGSVGRLVEAELGPPPHSLVVPGPLHFMEEEALKLIGGAGEDELAVHRERVERLLEKLKARGEA